MMTYWRIWVSPGVSDEMFINKTIIKIKQVSCYSLACIDCTYGLYLTYDEAGIVKQSSK